MQEIKYIETAKLKPHPSNPRLIKNDQFKRLCESLKANADYFETRPILCTPQMVIFAGNMRWRAAKEIGLEKVPVAIMDITAERQRELMIRDNRQNGAWDFEILNADFTLEELKTWGFEEWELSSGMKVDLPVLGDSNVDHHLMTIYFNSEELAEVKAVLAEMEGKTASEKVLALCRLYANSGL